MRVALADGGYRAVTADVDSGTYRVFGASRIEEIYELQRRVCLRPQTQALVPEICKYVLCPALDPGLTQFDTAGDYETRLPAADANVSNYNHLAFRAAAVVGSNVTNNNLDVPKSIQVGLRTTSGQVANVDFPIVGTQTSPYPYEYAFGSKTTLTTIRIPLKNFRVGNSSISLSDIEAITFDLMDEGTLVVDDIQFTR